MVIAINLHVGSGLGGLLGHTVYHHTVLRSCLKIYSRRSRREQSEHVWRWVDEHKLVVVFSYYWSFGCWVHVIKQNEVLDCLDWLACGIREKQLDVNWELAPAHLVHLERRLGDCDDRLWEARVKLKFDFGDEARYVFVVLTAHVAAPSIELLLLDLSAPKNGVCAKNDWLVNQIVASLVPLHYTATIRCIINELDRGVATLQDCCIAVRKLTICSSAAILLLWH